MRIIVDGTDLDLEENTVIAVTLTGNSLQNADEFQSSYTNEFTLPPTKTNLIALGNIPSLDDTGNEYLETSCEVINDEGLPMMVDARMLIREFTAGALNLNLVNGVVSFFDEIGETKLCDLDFSIFDHTWNLTNATNESPNVYTDGYAYAVCDFGNLVSTDNTIDVRELYPATFVKQIFLLIASQLTTYTFSESEYFVDSFFETLVLPFNGEQNCLYSGFEFYYNDVQLPTTPTLYDFSAALPFSPSDENSNFAGGYFTAPSNRTVDVRVWVEIDIDTYSSGTTTVECDIISSINGILGTVTLSRSSDGNAEDSTTVSAVLVAGETLTIDIDVTAVSVATENQITASLQTFPPVIEFGSTLSLESLMPDLTCAKFIKSVWKALGLQADVNTGAKIITLRDFQTYSTDTASAQDWSAKVDTLQDIEVEYSYGNYGLTNNFKYKADDSITTDAFADGEITVANAHLDETYNAVELELAPTDSLIIKSGALLIASIPILDATPAITTIVEPRLCYIELYTGTRPALAFTDGTGTNSNVTYSALKFVDPNNSENLSFNSNVLTERFAQFALMIQKMQKVTLNVNLSALDFNSLDFFKLKYLSFSFGFIQISGYFLLQEVKEYKGGETVQCEFINVNIV